MLLLTEKGIYAARDRLGRTPIVLGSRSSACTAALESCSFPNLGFEHERDLGPGEILMTKEQRETLHRPSTRMRIRTFFSVYCTGYAASPYRRRERALRNRWRGARERGLRRGGLRIGHPQFHRPRRWLRDARRLP